MNDIVNLETKPTSIEDLSFIQLPGVGGFPGPKCYIGNLDDVCSVVEAAGEIMYYVLATEAVKIVGPKGESVETTRPQIFKVLKSRTFHSVRPDPDNILGLKKVSSSATWDMPKIPMVMMDRIDAFLRAVYDRHKTEGIVILTFDSEYFGTEDPSEGWGFVVPDQSNTSAHCDYKPDSVMDRLATPTTFTVGTIHSHPMMSAFASGTDHADQASEDGLHITFGWSNQTKMETEYHVELAINKVNYSLELGQVVTARTKVRPAQDEVEDWLSHVTKDTVTAIEVMSTHGEYGSWHSSRNTGRPNFNKPRRPAKLYPATGPSLENNFVFAVIDSSVKRVIKCPFCDIPLTSHERNLKNCCILCQNYLGDQSAYAQPDYFSSLPAESPLKLAALEALRKGRDVFAWDPEGAQAFKLVMKASTGSSSPKVSGA